MTVKHCDRYGSARSCTHEEVLALICHVHGDGTDPDIDAVRAGDMDYALACNLMYCPAVGCVEGAVFDRSNGQP